MVGACFLISSNMFIPPGSKKPMYFMVLLSCILNIASKLLSSQNYNSICLQVRNRFVTSMCSINCFKTIGNSFVIDIENQIT